MRISLDYDKTYTADPAMWSRFMMDAKASGHEVVCVTMRHPHEAVEIGCDVVYTSRRAKRPFVDEIGLQIDIWIDDSPHWIFSDG